MNINIENQTLLYIILGVFVVHLLVMRYYVIYTVEKENKKSNKRLIKKVSKQINTTFEQYMGRSDMVDTTPENIDNACSHNVYHNTNDIDSIEDPIDEMDE